MSQAYQRTYCFQLSPPDSRPHPVLCNVSVSQLRHLAAAGTDLVASKGSTDLCTASASVDVDNACIGTGGSEPAANMADVTSWIDVVRPNLAKLG